jgi:hypothetical protein
MCVYEVTIYPGPRWVSKKSEDKLIAFFSGHPKFFFLFLEDRIYHSQHVRSWESCVIARSSSSCTRIVLSTCEVTASRKPYSLHTEPLSVHSAHTLRERDGQRAHTRRHAGTGLPGAGRVGPPGGGGQEGAGGVGQGRVHQPRRPRWGRVPGCGLLRRRGHLRTGQQVYHPHQQAGCEVS